ncbi:hypothetical protein [Actinomadura macra]|uniref:hypothetical protein n=1 Tax=Actinomadura macra TaxID=46164 RepID=UPI0012F8713C|nr:hypothetical protein [Actinomadura macra]
MESNGLVVEFDGEAGGDQLSADLGGGALAPGGGGHVPVGEVPGAPAPGLHEQPESLVGQAVDLGVVGHPVVHADVGPGVCHVRVSLPVVLRVCGGRGRPRDGGGGAPSRGLVGPVRGRGRRA